MSDHDEADGEFLIAIWGYSVDHDLQERENGSYIAENRPRRIENARKINYKTRKRKVEASPMVGGAWFGWEILAPHYV